MGFSLKIIKGPERGKIYSFDRIEIIVGRTMDNDMVLPDPGISRQHLSIRDKGGAYILKDLGSSNGTKLNGELIREEVLKPGDLINLGNVLVRFEQTVSIRPAETPSKPVRRDFSQPSGREPRAVGAREGARPQAPAQRRGARQAGTPPPAARPAAEAQAPVVRSPGMRQRQRNQAYASSPRLPERSRDRRPSHAPRRWPQLLGGRGTAALGPVIARLSAWFFGLDRRLRVVLIAVGSILFLVLVIKGFQGGRKLVRSVTDHSDEEFVAGEMDSDGEPMSYGYGSVKVRCKQRATFKFKYANGRATAKYAVAGVDNKEEVAIQVNENLVDYAPIILDKWSDEIRFDLPRKQLRENEENRLSFVNLVNQNDPGAGEEWGVEVTSIVETPLPSPNQNVAEEAFKMAQDRYQNKNVAPQNLYQSLESFKKARDYLELLPTPSRPEVYLEASEMVEKVEKELEKRYRSLVFSAEKAKEFKQFAKAKDLYRQIMLTIPYQEDTRYLFAKEKFEEIE